MITAPDNIAELLFAGRFVEESKLPRPNLIENYAAWRGLDSFRLSIPVNSLRAKIGIFDPNAVVSTNGPLCHGKFYLRCIDEERKALAVLALTPRILSQVITAKRDVLGRRGNGLAARGRENVIRSKHKHARFHLGLD